MLGVAKASFACLPLGALLTVACGSPAELDVARVEQGVVYDTDDRQELYSAPTDALRRFGEQSVVALVGGLPPDGAAVDPHDPFSAPSWGERRNLCDGVRFADQPAAAVCTGVLADADLVLTAGHCARNLDCGSLSLVFGYYFREGGAVPALAADDIYHCAEIPSFEIPSSAADLDYGWIRLDRPVSADKKPAALDAVAKALEPSATLRAFNFGGGVPLKVQTDVELHDPRPDTLDYFVTALDAFEGASGGPLLRVDGTVAGILVHGNADYEQSDTGCSEISVLPQADAAERATYAFRALAGLCRDSAQSTRLCRHAEAVTANGGCSLSAAPGSSAPVWLAVAALAALRRRIRASPHRLHAVRIAPVAVQ